MLCLSYLPKVSALSQPLQNSTSWTITSGEIVAPWEVSALHSGGYMTVILLQGMTFGYLGASHQQETVCSRLQSHLCWATQFVRQR